MITLEMIAAEVDRRVKLALGDAIVARIIAETERDAAKDRETNRRRRNKWPKSPPV